MYKEHQEEADELIQKRYLIQSTPGSKKPFRVDYSRGYMRAKIGYYIVLISRVMGLRSGG